MADYFRFLRTHFFLVHPVDLRLSVWVNIGIMGLALTPPSHNI